ncbi:type II toxin-antitoxin system RelE/ParE family toxin [uncultured Devosia sp.]|uniref:type II toxin-antitoxin system RelE/ParE family toxin n=1 Tax=uncultured Devosia sp. TaxID=211434 RepID=UPI0035CBD888
MKQRSVILLESAKRDLRDLTIWLAKEVSPAVARRYVDNVQSRIATLHLGAERGTIRDAGRALRVIGILPRTSLVFSVDDSHVYILRVLHGGQLFEFDDGDDQVDP